MKSIVIIIALFFVTLTAKADWVKKNGLEQIQLPDSNFFFTKVNDSCTKMLLVSQKNLKLYIVDLASGKIDREQKIPYNFDICDYDFELESFVFYEYLYLNGNPKDGIKNFNSRKTLNKLKSNDSLENFVGSEILNNGTRLLGEIYLINIINHDLFLSYNVKYNAGHGDTRIQVEYKSYINLDSKNESSPKYSIASSKQFQNGLFINNGGTGYVANTKGLFNINNTKEVNVGNPNFQVLDIYDLYLSCKIESDIISYVDLSTGKTINLSTKDSSNNTFFQMTNYKLINSIVEAVFFNVNDTMYVLDNYTGKITATIPFINGKLYFDKSKNILYSLKESNLYRTTITPNIKPNNEIIVSQSYFLFDDTIDVSKTDIYFYKNYSWEIDGVKYLDAQPKFHIKTAGSFDVKFSYEENGITKTILKEKAILVVDSLKVSYTVTSNNGFKVNLPVLFSANSNYPNATYQWKINHCSSYRQGSGVVKSIRTNIGSSNTFNDEFIYKDGNSVDLTVTNGYQTLTFNKPLALNDNLSASLDKYSGFTPLSVKIIASAHCNECGQGTTVTRANLNIGDFNKSFDNYLYEINNTFTKPGIYKISVSYTQFAKDTYYHDSVLTVLSPTDIQDFAERKYIFKQDAERIYCQLEGEGEVTLYDNVGRLVRTYQIENERYIRKEDFERGVYFLSIQTNGNVYHEKVLVE